MSRYGDEAMNQAAGAKHIPILDGIRGLAILLVIVCHTLGIFSQVGGIYESGIQRFVFFVFGNGWLGVDLFFVLSGYLITGILIRSRGEQNFFVNFYARRTLRIFPLYYMYITLVLFILPMFIPYMLGQINGYLYLNFLYLQNFIPIASGTLPEYLLSHLWSLAVEEHFYLIWPLIVYRVSDRKIFKLGAAVIAGAILVRCSFLFLSGMRTFGIEYYVYRFTLCRADALMLGAMLAYAVRNAHLSSLLQKYRLPCLYGSGLASVVLVVYAFLQNQKTTDVHASKIVSSIGYTIFSILFTFLIYNLLNARRESVGSRFFDNGIMKFFGKYSYAMYIAHYPIIAFIYANFLETYNCDPSKKVLILFVATLAITSVVSWLSYHLIEKHFLSLKRFFVSKQCEPKLQGLVVEN